MKRSLYQYFFFLLLVILTCGGLTTVGKRNQYVQAHSKTEIPTISSSVARKSTRATHEKVAISERNSSHYSRNHQDRHPILGELTDSDSEDEDTTETETSTELSTIAKAHIWNAVFAFVTLFHSNESAVFFAHSDFQNLPVDALYIQYRVIRL